MIALYFKGADGAASGRDFAARIVSDKWQTTATDRQTPKVASHQQNTRRNQPPRQTILYVPLPGFWLSGSRLCCRWVLQAVANRFRRPPTSETVAGCSQTVAIGCRMRKSDDSVSRHVRAITFLEEVAILHHRVTR